MIIFVRNLTTDSVSTDLGIVPPGVTISDKLTCLEMGETGKQLKTLVDLGYVEVTVAQETDILTQMRGVYFNPDGSIPYTTISFPKEQGNGIKIEDDFGWRDILGDLSVAAIGGGAPTLAAWRGGLARVPFWDGSDRSTLHFHIPHDHLPGSDLHLHLHWGHNGTAISGSLVVTYGVTYAKGHNQASYPAEVSPVLTIPTPNITTIPRWQHRIDEIQISSSTPDAFQIQTADIEPDGVLMVGVDLTTLPVITGGTPNQPALIFCDLHYQSTGIGTKNKIPNFWA